MTTYLNIIFVKKDRKYLSFISDLMNVVLKEIKR